MKVVRQFHTDQKFGIQLPLDLTEFEVFYRIIKHLAFTDCSGNSNIFH